MLIQVTHKTSYSFEHPADHGVQRIRLTPRSGPTQRVIDWELDLVGATEQLTYVDHLGNRVTLASIEAGTEGVEVVARGEVETTDRAGVVGNERDAIPLWYYRRPTTLTEPGSRIQELAERVADIADDVERSHSLSALILDAVEYRVGGTEPTTTAEEAVWAGEGVCQDHTHVFVAAARTLGIPSRYVSGYLKVDDEPTASAGHAWAEAHLSGLGWVGFDVSNGVSADDRYVRLAVGRDYREAAPIVGLRFGGGSEDLDVSIEIIDSASAEQAKQSQGQAQQSQGQAQQSQEQ